MTHGEALRGLMQRTRLMACTVCTALQTLGA